MCPDGVTGNGSSGFSKRVDVEWCTLMMTTLIFFWRRRAIATFVFQSFYRGNWNFFGTLKSYFRETNERSILRRLNSYYQIVVRWLQCLLIMTKIKIDGNWISRQVFCSIPALSNGTQKSILTVQGLTWPKSASEEEVNSCCEEHNWHFFGNYFLLGHEVKLEPI